MEGKEVMVTFIVVALFSPYTTILGRPWIHATGAVLSRAVHGSGGSSLCPTRNRLAGDRVGKCRTRNRPVLGSGFTGQFSVG